jgi:hypothetical protein
LFKIRGGISHVPKQNKMKTIKEKMGNMVVKGEKINLLIRLSFILQNDGHAF